MAEVNGCPKVVSIDQRRPAPTLVFESLLADPPPQLPAANAQWNSTLEQEQLENGLFEQPQDQQSQVAIARRSLRPVRSMFEVTAFGFTPMTMWQSHQCINRILNFLGRSSPNQIANLSCSCTLCILSAKTQSIQVFAAPLGRQ